MLFWLDLLRLQERFFAQQGCSGLVSPLRNCRVPHTALRLIGGGRGGSLEVKVEKRIVRFLEVLLVRIWSYCLLSDGHGPPIALHSYCRLIDGVRSSHRRAYGALSLRNIVVLFILRVISNERKGLLHRFSEGDSYVVLNSMPLLLEPR
jgi:hypothetical protein